MNPADPALDADVLRLLELHFDEDFYVSSYPDVVAAGCDPLLHYYWQGWREGRNPSRGFDTLHYLRLHADVAAAGLNPLLHYVRQGRAEGRSTRRPLDAWRRRLDDALTRRDASPSPEPDRAGWLNEADLTCVFEDRMAVRSSSS